MENNIQTAIGELQRKSNEIDTLVEDKFGKIGFDGILNFENYLNTNTAFKILWILKEQPSSNWDKSLVNSDCPKAFRGGTYLPIRKTSYMLLNNSNYNDAEKAINSKEMRIRKEDAKKIAIINIKKSHGQSRTGTTGIDEAYKEYGKEIIVKQILLYSPDIIIGGISSFPNTVSALLKDVGFPPLPSMKNSSLGHIKGYSIKNSKQLFINAYHPGQTKVPKSVYCDEIITCIKQYYPIIRAN